MSDQTPQPNYKEAKAAAKAEKARAKALRPWFKKKRFIGLGIIALIVVISIASNSGTKKGFEDGYADASNESSSQTVAKLGDTVTDGDFSFVASNMKCGIKQYGGEYANAKAQGQYCQFDIAVTNNGDDAQYFSGTDQYLFSADGKKFESDSSAAIYADSSNTWLDKVNPGNTLKGLLIFDVPADVELDHLELHDGIFSTGVEVSVK